MAFNISDFSSNISRRGIQKNHSFEVVITPPTSMEAPDIIKDIPIRCNTVNLPGVTLGVDDVRHKGYGLAEKRPIQVGFEDISLTMIADAQGQLNKFLLDWMQLIYPIDNEQFGDNIEYFEYPINYYGGLEIFVYDNTGAKHSTFTLVDPYPNAVGSLQMGWENVDSVQIIPVSFAYRSFKRNSQYRG